MARAARDSMGIEQVMFTGGEPTLHPNFGEILSAISTLGLKSSFVTNGWHFERIWPALTNLPFAAATTLQPAREPTSAQLGQQK